MHWRVAVFVIFLAVLTVMSGFHIFCWCRRFIYRRSEDYPCKVPKWLFWPLMLFQTLEYVSNYTLTSHDGTDPIPKALAFTFMFLWYYDRVSEDR